MSININIIVAIIVIIYILSIPAAYAFIKFGLCSVIYEMIDDITEDGKKRIFKCFLPLIFRPVANTFMMIIFALCPIRVVHNYIYMRVRNDKDFINDMHEIAKSPDK